MIYYAQRKSIKNGVAEINNRFGERADMRRQYHLYCASASTNEADNDFDYIEWGTVEQGALQHDTFVKPAPEPTPEPEEEPTE